MFTAYYDDILCKLLLALGYELWEGPTYMYWQVSAMDL